MGSVRFNSERIFEARFFKLGIAAHLVDGINHCDLHPDWSSQIQDGRRIIYIQYIFNDLL